MGRASYNNNENDGKKKETQTGFSVFLQKPQIKWTKI